MSYIKVDDAIQLVISKGQGALLAKIDIRSAFRLIPVHPADRHFLCMLWGDQIFVDTCLPFGLRSAPKPFNIDLLEWIAKEYGVLHYLDDFLTVGAPDSQECHQNLDRLIQLCEAIEKVGGPASSLAFLGILLDTLRMEARLPEEKLKKIQDKVRAWLLKKNATKRLVGLLQHAAKVVRPGRSFVRRMFMVAAKVKRLDDFTRLNNFRSDLLWWHTFLAEWNGVSFLHHTLEGSVSDVIIQTDASGSWGCGAFFNGKWLQWKWPSTWEPMAKELA